jgi:hypothetical protein
MAAIAITPARSFPAFALNVIISPDVSFPAPPRILASKPQFRGFQQQRDYTKVCFAYYFGQPLNTLV